MAKESSTSKDSKTPTTDRAKTKALKAVAKSGVGLASI